MTLTKQHLVNTFEGARNNNSPYVFVGIEAEGIKEVISIPSVSFDAKEQFYNNAYSNKLVHVMNSKVKIIGLTHGYPEALTDLV
ncbi:hypothetical protein [Lysinibacillus sp. NPDC086135]|uniref:hypothetical protein n=1 Tax=Lysinibacillus sp. NPDC086135 TaxID=3364130 RepID=UPI0037F702D2